MKPFLYVIAFSFVVSATVFAKLPSVGPDYQRPETSAPSTYRDAAPNNPNVAGSVSDPTPSSVSTEWWLTFNDPQLNALEARALAANQDLRAALARVEQARAVSGVARSAYLPSLSLDPSIKRERASETVPNALPDSPATTHTLPVNLSWEIDLFGRTRRLNESARAEFAAAGASYEAARLALTAEVATTHFTLRAIDDELRIVTSTVGVRRDALKLAQSRYKQGTSGDLDVARAETELASTEADAAALAIRRASTETALAVLLGEAAPSFNVPFIAVVSTNDNTATAANAQSVSSTAASSSVPTAQSSSTVTANGSTAALTTNTTTNAFVSSAVPSGLPSELLTRRPDIAAAERTLAAASARIGVAKSSFFPAISLTGSAGYASTDISDLFKSDSRLWSIGPSVYLPLFQGGRNKANLARSRAAFEESLATYRQSVLVAFREVQDALTASRLLEDQAAAQARAVESARRGARLSQVRYDAGYVSYFEVVDAQRTALDIERTDARLNGQRWITRVALIKALGGGWQQPTS